MRFAALTALLLIAIASASCGSSAARAGSVRESLASLKHALRARDARTVCELIFPYGRDLPEAGLQKRLHDVSTPTGREQYQAYLHQCSVQFPRDPGNFSGWERIVGNLSVLSVKTRGDVATARVTVPTGRTAVLQFVNAAGKWRLLFRFA